MNKVSPMHVAANIRFESPLESGGVTAAGNNAKNAGSRMNSAAPIGDSQVLGTTLKLRDLLTQGMENSEASSSVVPSSGEQSKNSEHMLYTNSKENCGSNIILRELLNQDEEENSSSGNSIFVQAKVEKTGSTAERSRRASASSSGINTVLRTVRSANYF